MNQQSCSIRRAKKTPRHLFSQFYIAPNITSLAFGLLSGQRKKQHEDVPLENIFPMVDLLFWSGIDIKLTLCEWRGTPVSVSLTLDPNH